MNYSGTHHQHAGRGLAQSFGLHPAVALLTVIVDSMLFTGEVVTLGAGWLLSLLVSAVVGFLAFRAQVAWYGDDEESATIKAGILALLTAIPSALPSFIYLPMGFIGFFRRSSPAPEVKNPPVPDTTDTSRSKDLSLPFYG